MRDLRLCFLSASLALLGCSGAEVSRVRGLKALEPCPSSPNCVSTEAADTRHAIAPLACEGTPAQAQAKLLGLLSKLPRARIVSLSDGAVDVEFRSRVFRFVDDVQFRFRGSDRTIRFRSASRAGYSDFGANRRRMERIRRAYQEAGSRP